MLNFYTAISRKVVKKGHATITKGIVGGFKFAFPQRNLKERHESGHGYMFVVLKESNKSRFDSYNVGNSISIISPITFRDCRGHIFRQPFSK